MATMLELYHGGPVFSDTFRGGNFETTHPRSFHTVNDLDFTGERVLYLHRNPIDVMYSLHIYYVTPGIADTNVKHFEDDDPDITHVEARLTGWMSKWTKNVIKWVYEPPPGCKERLILSYEQMVEDTEGCLGKAVEFIWPGRKAQPLRCKACAQAVTRELIDLLVPQNPRTIKIHRKEDKSEFINKHRDLIIKSIDDERIFELYPDLSR